MRLFNLFALQTTRSKESLIEFISAEKVAWDNLAAPLGDGFLPFPMGISTNFSTFQFLFSEGFRDHLSSKESF